jgi:GGDEF domain-containing protein
MFISLKRYLDNRPEQVTNALLRMVRLLLQGIEYHAVKGDAVDYERFRADMEKVQDSLGEQPNASEVLVLAGATVKALEDYNARTTRFLQLQTNELQTMIAMLTKTMTSLASGSESSVARLQAVEKQLHKASMIEDFQSAKIRMSECLESLRTEIVRQREESARHVTELRDTIQQSKERTAAAATESALRDAVTGLPERAEAEAALASASNGNRPIFAAIFVVERVDLINARFGHAVGDQILLYFYQHLAQSLDPADRMFRWSGPALLALLDRHQTIGQLREELTRIASKRLAKTVTVGARSVLLPVAANWTLYPVSEIRPVQLLIQNLDEFVHGAFDTASKVGA